MKLPNVFANKIDKTIKNNEDFFHGDRNNVKRKNPEDLKKYFDKTGYANKLLVNIRTKDGESLKKLILCKDNYVIDINNSKIYFNDIIDYEVK